MYSVLDKTPTDRMKRKILKENLWFFILKLVREKPRYGNELRAHIKKKFGFFVGSVTAYKVLYDLESMGYVNVSGDYKKKYILTNKGQNELRRSIKFLKDIATEKNIK